GGADGARQAPGEERVCVAAGEGVDEILKGLRIRDEHREQIPLTVAVDYILSLASILSATEPPSPCVPTGSCPSPLRQECASSSRLRGAQRDREERRVGKERRYERAPVTKKNNSELR